MSKIANVAVIGAGTMGSGIAQACAMSGLSVKVFDAQDQQLNGAIEKARTSLARFVKSGKINEAASDQAFNNIQKAKSLEDAVGAADFVFEAVPEKIEIKKDVFRQASRAAKASTILASNTSQLSITAIASATDCPDRVIGTHFFNPVVMMRFVEVVRGIRTSDSTLEATLQLMTTIGKETAVCKRDVVGFITTRAAVALRLECIRIFEEGIASVEDIDKAMRLGFNHPMGPFEMSDANGLDVALLNATSLYEAYGDRFLPPQSLGALVNAGMLGRKTGAGWYDYSSEKKK